MTAGLIDKRLARPVRKPAGVSRRGDDSRDAGISHAQDGQPRLDGAHHGLMGVLHGFDGPGEPAVVRDEDDDVGPIGGSPSGQGGIGVLKADERSDLHAVQVEELGFAWVERDADG